MHFQIVLAFQELFTDRTLEAANFFDNFLLFVPMLVNVEPFSGDAGPRADVTNVADASFLLLLGQFVMSHVSFELQERCKVVFLAFEALEDVSSQLTVFDVPLKRCLELESLLTDPANVA